MCVQQNLYIIYSIILKFCKWKLAMNTPPVRNYFKADDNINDDVIMP